MDKNEQKEATYVVGPGGTHKTIQAALEDAVKNPKQVTLIEVKPTITFPMSADDWSD